MQIVTYSTIGVILKILHVKETLKNISGKVTESRSLDMLERIFKHVFGFY